MTFEIITLILLFVAVFAGTISIFSTLEKKAVRKRIDQFVDHGKQKFNTEDSELVQTLVKFADPISKLSLPEEGWENSHLQKRFVNAGLRGVNTPKLFFAAKTLLTILLSILAYILFGQEFSKNPSNTFFFIFLFLAIGYYLPNIILNSLIEKRQSKILDNLPDMVDLLLVCIESGLSFEQAFARVSKEIKIKSEVLAEEMEMVLLEIRSGFTRDKALKNFALRTGVGEVESLVNMLNQSERFGTSVGDGLRVHSENTRTKRRQKAEETAAKIPLKLLFPLLMCLMPAIFIVMLVPSMMQIKEAIGM